MVIHDDGVTLIVDGHTVINNPIPPSTVNAECRFGPAYLQVTGLNNVQAPSSFLLIDGGLFGLIRYRKYLLG